MANQPSMDKAFAINNLRDAGYSERRIAETLGASGDGDHAVSRTGRAIRKKAGVLRGAKRRPLVLAYRRLFFNQTEKLRGQDSNLRPRGYEPRELPGCSTPRYEDVTVFDAFPAFQQTAFYKTQKIGHRWLNQRRMVSTGVILSAVGFTVKGRQPTFIGWG